MLLHRTLLLCTGRRYREKGQVLGIIEAMKLMNEIESEYDGIVEAVLVNNEEVGGIRPAIVPHQIIPKDGGI